MPIKNLHFKIQLICINHLGNYVLIWNLHSLNIIFVFHQKYYQIFVNFIYSYICPCKIVIIYFSRLYLKLKIIKCLWHENMIIDFVYVKYSRINNRCSHWLFWHKLSMCINYIIILNTILLLVAYILTSLLLLYYIHWRLIARNTFPSLMRAQNDYDNNNLL